MYWRDGAAVLNCSGMNTLSVVPGRRTFVPFTIWNRDVRIVEYGRWKMTVSPKGANKLAMLPFNNVINIA